MKTKWNAGSLPPWLLSLLLVGGLLLSAVTVQAANWPTRPLVLVVPYPPGGAADTVGRIYAEALGQSLGQPVVVENRPGAGTAIAAEQVLNRPADGYTLSLVPTGQLTVLPHLVDNLRFGLDDFAPVSLLAATGVVIAANNALPVASLQDLIALAKARPGALSYSSSGSGTIIHLAGEYFLQQTGTQLLHVPFRGSAPAVSAVAGGSVDVSVDTLTILAPQIRAGNLRGLAIASPARSPLLPDVPTVAELGYPGFEVVSWFGLAVAGKTPDDIIQRLNREIRQAAALPALQQRLAGQGLTPWPTTPEAFAEQLRSDHEKYGAVVRTANITFD